MQYALFLAAQGDDLYERALGPIHLLKYTYLADMDYARFNEGRTYSGIDWKFHHFGPWSLEAFQEIDAALEIIEATKNMFPSTFGDKDCVRWNVEFDQYKFADLKSELPLEVKQSLQKNVHRFRNDTTLLLHYVYATPPMLNAAPEELMDFRVMVPAPPEVREEFTPYLVRLTGKKRKQLKQGMDVLRERFMAEAGKTTIRQDSISGKLDDVYMEGIQWLDNLAGTSFPEGGGSVHFTDDIWKSKARSGDA